MVIKQISKQGLKARLECSCSLNGESWEEILTLAGLESQIFGDFSSVMSLCCHSCGWKAWFGNELNFSALFQNMKSNPVFGFYVELAIAWQGSWNFQVFCLRVFAFHIFLHVHYAHPKWQKERTIKRFTLKLKVKRDYLRSVPLILDLYPTSKFVIHFKPTMFIIDFSPIPPHLF